MRILFLTFLLVFQSLNIVNAEVVIPVMVGQTGASATFGEQELKAYQLAVKEWNQRGGINGEPIKLLVEDTQTKQASIISAYYRLAIKDPIVIMGPTWLEAFPAIIPIAKKNNLAIVTPSAASESLIDYGEWPITLYFNTTIEIQTLLSELKQQLQAKTFGLIYEQEPYAEFVSRLIRNQPINLVYDKGIQGGEVDFRTTLSRMKEQPDVMIILIWEERSLLSFFQQINLLKKDMTLATVHDGDGWITNKNFQPFIQQLAYSKFVIKDRSFVERFQEQYHEKPILTASTAYDVANNVFTALAKGAKTGQEVRDYLLSNQLETVSFGKIKLDKNGAVPVSDVELVKYAK